MSIFVRYGSSGNIPVPLRTRAPDHGDTIAGGWRGPTLIVRPVERPAGRILVDPMLICDLIDRESDFVRPDPLATIAPRGPLPPPSARVAAPVGPEERVTFSTCTTRVSPAVCRFATREVHNALELRAVLPQLLQVPPAICLILPFWVVRIPCVPVRKRPHPAVWKILGPWCRVLQREMHSAIPTSAVRAAVCSFC